MSPSATLLLICVEAVALVLLLVRFVQPEIVYSLRKHLIEAEILYLVLKKVDGQGSNSDRLPELLGQVSYAELQLATPTFAYKRISKIREVYHLVNQSAGTRGASLDRRTQDCLAEVGTLIATLSKYLEANPSHSYPLVKADEILLKVANVMQASGAEPIDETRLNSTYFQRNPMSVEQLLEVGIAVVLGLANRLQAQGIK